MAEYIRDGLQRMPLVEHAGGKAMPEGMCALAEDLDARSPDMTLHNRRRGAGMSQRVIGRAAGQKNVGVGIRGTGVLQVIQQTLTDLDG